MSKVIKLKSEQVICEGTHLSTIYNCLTPESKNLIISNMNTGKTYTASELFKLRQNCIKVFLVPRNSLGKDVACRFKEKHKVKMLFECDIIKPEELKDCVIITSPESFLKKVIPCVKELNLDKEMFTIYDEIHLAIDDSSYRKSLYDVLKIEKELKGFKTKFTLLGLTATEGALREFLEFDNIIEVSVSNKFRQTGRLDIIQGKGKFDEKYITASILKCLEENPKSRIVIKLNDKEKIDTCAEMITKKIGEKPLILSSKDKDNLDIVLENKNVIKHLICFVTDFTEVGIEIKNTDEIILLTFEGLNNNPINHNSIIQHIGRARNGWKAVICHVEKNKKTLYPNLKNIHHYIDISIKRQVRESLDFLIPSLYTDQKDDSLEYEVICDIEYEIMKKSMKHYLKNLINNAQDLKKKLEESKTLNIPIIQIIETNYEDMYNYLQEFEEPIKEKRNASKQKKKEWREELNDLIRISSDEDIKNFYLKEEVFSSNGKKIIELLEYLGEYDKVLNCYTKLKKAFKGKLKKFTNKRLLELSINYKDTLLKCTRIQNNIDDESLRKEGIEFIRKDDMEKEFKMQRHIMKVIREMTGDKTPFRLTNIIKDTILEKCKYDEIKGTKKDPYKKLIEVLKTYYVISPDNKGLMISSIKNSYQIRYFK